MSLLTICQAVAQDIPVAAPGTIVGNPDTTATLLLSQANLAGESLARYPQGGWVSMMREYDFQTSAIGPMDGYINNTGPNGVAQITGLSSTAGLAADTWYGFGNGLPNNSIIASVDSATQVTMNVAATSPGTVPGPGQYVFGQSDYPLPSDFQRLIDNTMWDRSRYWSMRGPQSPQQWQMYKSSVIGRASIQRRWRVRNIDGVNKFSIDPVPTDNAAALVFEYVSNGWCRSQAGVYQNQWQSDSDVGVVDEWLLQLGVRWRMLRRLGMSYSEELDEYERQVSKATAQDGGAAILSIVPSAYLAFIGPNNIVDGNFPSSPIY